MASSAPSPDRMFWGSCPDCGAALDVRDGEYGQFLGCSAYPECDYSRSLDRAERNILADEGYLDRIEDGTSHLGASAQGGGRR